MPGTEGIGSGAAPIAPQQNITPTETKKDETSVRARTNSNSSKVANTSEEAPGIKNAVKTAKNGASKAISSIGNKIFGSSKKTETEAKPEASKRHSLSSQSNTQNFLFNKNEFEESMDRTITANEEAAKAPDDKKEELKSKAAEAKQKSVSVFKKLFNNFSKMSPNERKGYESEVDSSVKSLGVTNTTKAENVLNEFATTEETFLSNIQKYNNTLDKLAKDKKITQEDKAVLQDGWKELETEVKKNVDNFKAIKKDSGNSFLSKLIKFKESFHFSISSSFGKIMTKLSNTEKYTKCLAILDKYKGLKEIQDISNIPIMPIQRGPRYVLLAQELSKDPKNNPIAAVMEDTLNEIKETAAQIDKQG